MKRRVPANVLADRLVACKACGAAFGEPCTPPPPRSPTKGARRLGAKPTTAPAPGTISCIIRRIRRHMAFRGMGDDPVGWLLAHAGPGGTRDDVIAVLRERAAK